MSAVLQEQIIAPEQPHTLEVKLPVTGEFLSGIKPAGAVAEARNWDIDSTEMAQFAANQRTTWATRIDNLKKMRADFLDPAKKIVEAAAKWFNPPLEDLEQGRAILGTKLVEWQQAESVRIAKENAEREAADRKARQDAERKAAEERAKAEEIARQERAKADAAAAALKKAQDEGDAKAAREAAIAEAAARERANAAIETGNAKAQEVQIAAAAATSAPVEAVAKIAGSSLKDNWIAKLQPNVSEDMAKSMIVNAASTNETLQACLKIDMSAINKLAKALKKQMNVPGFVAVNDQTIAGARK